MTYALPASVRASTDRVQDERKASRIPAVVYGHGLPNQLISVAQSDFNRVFSKAGFSSLIDLSLGQQTPVKVVIKEVQRHPLRLDPIHIDFQQIRMDEEMLVSVPVHFVGESAAVKVGAGTLIKSLDEIEIRCLPGNLPAAIEVDISALKTFDDAITVHDLVLPAGVSVMTAAEVTIATVAAPLTEEQLKKMEQGEAVDVTAVKTEGEEKRAQEEAKKAEEAALEKK